MTFKLAMIIYGIAVLVAIILFAIYVIKDKSNWRDNNEND